MAGHSIANALFRCRRPCPKCPNSSTSESMPVLSVNVGLGPCCMPRLVMLAKPTNLLARVYTPDYAVGVGGRNLRKDVLLVQFLLAAVQRKPEVSGGVTRDYSRDSSGKLIPVAVDGICGTLTITAIRRYQELYDIGQDPTSIATMIHDSRIDPAGHSLLGPRQGHILTIARLNMLYRAHFGEDAHNRLFLDSQFPKELHDDFYVV